MTTSRRGPADEPTDLRILAERASAGDVDAWEALYRHARHPLLAHARRRLRSADAAEDAVSETMARAIGRIGSFTWQGGGVDAWLHGILRNVVLEKQRAGHRVVLRHTGDEASAEGGPEEVALRREQVVLVRAALAMLPDNDRQVLDLRFVNRLSAHEIGAVLEKEPGAVRMAQSRALGRLRRALDDLPRRVAG